jgi:hypothetical protein
MSPALFPPPPRTTLGSAGTTTSRLLHQLAGTAENPVVNADPSGLTSTSKILTNVPPTPQPGAPPTPVVDKLVRRSDMSHRTTGGALLVAAGGQVALEAEVCSRLGDHGRRVDPVRLVIIGILSFGTAVLLINETCTSGITWKPLG